MTTALANVDAPDRIVIRLLEVEPEVLGVEAVILSISSIRIRFSAAGSPALGAVLQPDVACAAASICEGAADVMGTISRPDFMLRVQGLTLEGYTVSVSRGEDGRRRFNLTLVRALGNTLAVFRLSPRADTGLALFTARILSGPDDRLNSERLFDEMLSQLYLPLVNLNAYLRHVLDGSLADRGVSLSNSVVQLKTRAETLQFAFDRLIAEMMVDKYTDEGESDRLMDSNAA